MIRRILIVFILVSLLGGAQVMASVTPPAQGDFVFGVNTPEIYREGLRQGNNPSAFSKVGDSNTANPLFSVPVGNGGLHLEEHEYMRGVFEYFSVPYNSFTNQSVAARGGWTSVDLLTPGAKSDAPNAGGCRGDENPLQCEYRIVRPSIAFIMIGTNDILHGHSDDAFRANLNTIVDITKSYGVIPILSTIPDIRNGYEEYYGRVYKFNEIIRSVAANQGVPLWDLWADLQPLPNLGLTGDGLHLSAPESGETAIFSNDMLTHYGFTVRNFRLLRILDEMNLHLRPQ